MVYYINRCVLRQRTPLQMNLHIISQGEKNYQMMDENKLLLASLTDKYECFLQYEYLIVSDFLNL